MLKLALMTAESRSIFGGRIIVQNEIKRPIFGEANPKKYQVTIPEKTVGLGCSGIAGVLAAIFIIGDGVAQQDLGKVIIGAGAVLYLNRVSSLPASEMKEVSEDQLELDLALD